MNKIFNWVFGSFFRTLGRILVYILICYLLLNLINLDNIKLPDFWQILNVYAEEGDWYSAVKYTPNLVSYYNCTSNGCSSVSYDNQYLQGYCQTNDCTINYFENSDSLTIANNGIIISSYLNGQLKSGHLYLIKSFICSSFSGSWNTFVANINLGGNFGAVASISSYGVITQSSNITTMASSMNIGETCYQVNSIVVPDNDAQYYGLRLTANPSKTGYISFIGYDYELIGLYNGVTKSDIDNAISNSGFATASSVNQVQSSINQVQTELQNTQTAIDSQTQQQHADSQAEINAANQNTDKTIDSQKVCSTSSYKTELGTLTLATGENADSNNRTRTDFINVLENNSYRISVINNTVRYLVYEYDAQRRLIQYSNWKSNNSNFLTTNNTKFIRIILENGILSTINIYGCSNGNQAMNDSINDMNSSINNSDSSQATNDASNFFSNFSTNTHGLTGIITAPLNAINSLTSAQCSPLVLPLPFVNQNLTLPCMRPIYQQYFGNFMTLYDIITLGIVSYWVMVRIFGLVKDFKNPEHDEIEVVDL